MAARGGRQLRSVIGDQPLEAPQALLELALRLEQLECERRAAHIDAEILHQATRDAQPRKRRDCNLPLARGSLAGGHDAELCELEHGLEIEPAELADLVGGDPVILSEYMRLEHLSHSYHGS